MITFSGKPLRSVPEEVPDWGLSDRSGGRVDSGGVKRFPPKERGEDTDRRWVRLGAEEAAEERDDGE